MGTLVLKEKIVYLAYLAGYLGEPAKDVLDFNWDDDDAEKEIAYAAAHALGRHDYRTEEEPQPLRCVLASVHEMLNTEEPRQPPAEPV